MKCILIVVCLFILSSCDFIKEGSSKKNEAVEQSFSVHSNSVGKKVLNGKVRYKFPSGKLKSIVNYKNNQKVGTSHTFYETGEKQYEIPYVDGKKHGLVKWFYKSGKLYRSTNYRNGLKHGSQKKYWENGKLKSEMFFENNMMCAGLKEISNTGKCKTGPSIQVKHVNLVGQKNMYHLELSLSKKFKNVKFYIGNLINGKCLPLSVNSSLSELKTANGKAIFKFSIPKNSRMNKDIPIVAVVKTSYQNHYILSTQTHVRVQNSN